MSRKPTETVQVNLRIKEALRRRLEREAKKRGVSLNYEMTSRIDQSFNIEGLRDQETVTEDMKGAHARFMQPFLGIATQNLLRDAAEMLVVAVKNLPAECREHEEVRKALAAVSEAQTVMDLEAVAAVRRVGHV